MHIVYRALDKNGSSILDVGCGNGAPMRFINRRRSLFSVGIDLFMPNIKECKKKEIHDEYVYCDARFLPFKRKSFDIALCLRVPEMLKKRDGLKLIKDIENIARKQVIVSTTVGFIPPNETEENINPLQLRKSGWAPMEFREWNYRVAGQGLRIIYGKWGLEHRLPENLKWLGYLTSYLLEPLVYFLPSLAAHMICVKNVT
jgi:SAM-dependent methyltransferase